MPPWTSETAPRTKGKTSAQRSLEIQNAEAATRIRTKMLQSLEEVLLSDGADALETVKAIRTETLKLLKDTEDRGLGTAVQSVDHTSSDGTMTPAPTRIELVAPDIDNSED